MAKQTEFLPLPWEQAKGAQFKEVTGPLFPRCTVHPHRESALGFSLCHECVEARGWKRGK